MDLLGCAVIGIATLYSQVLVNIYKHIGHITRLFFLTLTKSLIRGIVVNMCNVITDKLCRLRHGEPLKRHAQSVTKISFICHPL